MPGFLTEKTFISCSRVIKTGTLLCSLGLLGLLLVGCAGGSYAPVADRNVAHASAPPIYTAKQSVHTSDRFYRVQQSDTLYSIAFRYGKDFRALARANDIDSNYRIYPGQLIKLSEKPAAPIRKTQTASARSSNTQINKQKVSKQRSAVTNSKNLKWIWPVKGQVIQGFSSKVLLNKGINIAASSGDAVHAAASGEVVYAGSGLLGYGNLIIIKHDSQYLSAYAHNSKILVKENNHVNQGAKIAEVGKSGTTRTMLHFEIRKNGKPVNPLQYLPK